MDETGLSHSILQFVGGHGLPAPGTSPDASLSVTRGADALAAGERAGQPSGEDEYETDKMGGMFAGTGSTATCRQQYLQNKGLMRAFVGAKLGEFNMRGVEAGMSMCNVEKKPGKVLNTQDRRQRRTEQSNPYGGKGSSSRLEKKNGPERLVVGNVYGFEKREEEPDVASDLCSHASKDPRAYA